MSLTTANSSSSNGRMGCLKHSVKMLARTPGTQQRLENRRGGRTERLDPDQEPYLGTSPLRLVQIDEGIRNVDQSSNLDLSNTTNSCS